MNLFCFNLRKLEELIMATRAELVTAISELSTTITSESDQVKESVTALQAVISGLNEKISTLELSAEEAADFSKEMEALTSVKSSIEAIYQPSIETVVTPVQ